MTEPSKCLNDFFLNLNLQCLKVGRGLAFQYANFQLNPHLDRVSLRRLSESCEVWKPHLRNWSLEEALEACLTLSIESWKPLLLLAVHSGYCYITHGSECFPLIL